MKYTQTLENRAYDALKMIDLRSDEFQSDLMDFFIEKPLGDWQRFEDELLDSITDKILVPKVKKYLAAWLSDLKKAKKDREKAMKTMMVNPPIELTDTENVRTMLADVPEVYEVVMHLPTYRLDDHGVWDKMTGERISSTPFAISYHYGSAQNDGDDYEITYIRQEEARRIPVKYVFDALTILTQQSITSLSKIGIIISSKTAGACIDYITQMLGALKDKSALKYGVSTRLFGWTTFTDPKTGEKKAAFAPYEKEVRFAGAENWPDLYDDMVAVGGDEAAYFKQMKEWRARKMHEFAITIAASLCGVMLGPIFDKSPFIIHVYGGSNKGKSTWARIAMSQFGHPADGTLMGKYNGTNVGVENRIGVLNNFPIVLDDILTGKDSKDKDADNKKLQSLVYSIVTGSGRDVGASGAKAGTNRLKKRWKTVFLSSAEGPLSSHFNRGGALNRVIEVPIRGEFTDKELDIMNAYVLANYGHVIRKWLEVLHNLNKEDVLKMYNEYHEKIMEIKPVTGRQAEPLAMVLTADKLATDYIYKDGIYLEDDLETLCSYLKTKDDISDGGRAMKAIYDYYISNPGSFILDKVEEQLSAKTQDGWRVGNTLYVIPSRFKYICQQCDYDFSMVVEYCKDEKYFLPDWAGSDGYPKTHRIPGSNGKKARAYMIDLTRFGDPIAEVADAEVQQVKYAGVEEEKKALEQQKKEIEEEIKKLKEKLEQMDTESGYAPAPEVEVPFEKSDGIEYPVFTMGKEMNNHDAITL